MVTSAKAGGRKVGESRANRIKRYDALIDQTVSPFTRLSYACQMLRSLARTLPPAQVEAAVQEVRTLAKREPQP